MADLHRLRHIADEAGRAIMEVYAGSPASWAKADGSPLTEADLRADRIIQASLAVHWPQWPVWSEEGAGAPARDCKAFFLVDPLDGTREFLQRNDEFTVNIALVVDGRPVAGLVSAPALGETFFGMVGQGAWKLDAKGEVEIRCGNPEPGGPLRILGSRNHGGEALARWLEQLPEPYGFVAAGSSLKFCRLAEGRADLYPRLGPTSQWDTAAGQAVLESAGGAVLGPDGEPLRYGPERPLLNSHFIALACPGRIWPPIC